MNTIITLLGVLVAWIIYRHTIISKRSSYLIALEELLKTTGAWFDTAYPIDMENEGWKDATYMVYKVDISLINSIITEGGYIFGDNFIKKLVQFAQLVTRFNQYVDVHTDFVNSNYAKLREKEDNAFKRRAHVLMKKLHTVGIGSYGFHDNPKDFPFLHRCFKDLKNDIENEKKKNSGILYWKNFIILDSLLFLLPIGYIFLESLKLLLG